MIGIAAPGVSAQIDPTGAELVSLRDAQGREYMHDGDPAWWTGRAPLLFPNIGRLNGDILRVDGVEYPMPKHGFARRSQFEVARVAQDSAAFVLTDTAETRARYPFAFRLTVTFRVLDAMLQMTATVENTDARPLPFAFGYHPAFRWPLPGGGPRDGHIVAFAEAESGALMRVMPDGLIDPAPRSSPLDGKLLTLSDALFTDDALVWPALASRSLRYGAPGGPALDIAFPDTMLLGIWTKPGAPFLCIEPWAGHADPAGYAGEFAQKPGIETLMPGDARSFRMSVTIRT